MWRKRIQTNYALWAAISFMLFVAICSFNLNGAKGASYWDQWAIFLSGQYGCSADEFILVLGIQGLVLAIPSLVLGWIAQAVVQVLLTAMNRRST